MKQAILELKKKLLLVELPEGAKDIEKSVLGDIMYKDASGLNVIWLPKERSAKSLIGKLTDITEEQFWPFVSMHKVSDDTWRYANFKNLSGKWFDTAKESFFSYLEVKGIRFENKIEMPVLMFSDYDFGKEGASAETIESIEFDFDERMNQWQEAEEKVWNLSNCYIFKII